MAVRTYCTIVTTVLRLLKCGDLVLIPILLCFTNSKTRYCPIAYTIATEIKAEKPQLVDTLIISEMLLSDESIINEETTIEMTIKNFLVLNPVRDTCKRLTILFVIDRFSAYHLLIIGIRLLCLINTDILIIYYHDVTSILDNSEIHCLT
jgi:hypothetical protein